MNTASLNLVLIVGSITLLKCFNAVHRAFIGNFEDLKTEMTDSLYVCSFDLS